MDAGYNAPDALARAFRQRFGQSPSSFQKSTDWLPVSGEEVRDFPLCWRRFAFFPEVPEHEAVARTPSG